MKIRTKLFVTVLVFSIVILIAGFFVITVSQNSLKEDIGQRSILLTKGMLDDIDSTIHLRAEEIRLYSQDRFLREQIKASNAQFEAISNKEAYIVEKDREWRSAELTNDFIDGITSNELSVDLRRKSDFYIDEHGHSVFPEIFVTNKYGVNVAQTAKTSDYLQSDEDWWVQARDNGYIIQDVEYDASAQVYSTDIVTRVDGENGEFLGVIKATLRIEEPLHIIRQKEGYTEFGRSDFKLFTSDGKLIYSTEEGESPLVDITSEEYYLQTKGKDQGYFIAREEGEDFDELSSFSRSKGHETFQGLGWILIIERDTKAIFGPVTKLRNNLLIIFFVVVALGFLRGYLVSRSLVQPIEKLARNSVEIGKGNFEVQSDIKRNDEIGTLAASIDTMTKDLKQLEQDKNNFLNIVSHELKTPLTSIFAYLDILEGDLKKKLSKDQKGQFATIRNNSDQLVSLINNILEMARMEANKFELIQTDVDVTKMVDEVITSLGPVATNNGNKLLKDLKNIPKTIVTDEQRLKEIFNNLVSNAIKFTENGTITIEASAKGENLFIAVKDTGVGIPQENLKDLFEKFYQVDASISRKYGGTGLGLSITKELIERQGGVINVTSKKGKGTTFSFTLPIKGMPKEEGEKAEQKKHLTGDPFAKSVDTKKESVSNQSAAPTTATPKQTKKAGDDTSGEAANNG